MLEKEINDESEIQIRKMSIINFEINNAAQDAQKAANELLGIDDDSLIKFGKLQMSGIRFKNRGKMNIENMTKEELEKLIEMKNMKK